MVTPGAEAYAPHLSLYVIRCPAVAFETHLPVHPRTPSEQPMTTRTIRETRTDFSSDLPVIDGVQFRKHVAARVPKGEPFILALYFQKCWIRENAALNELHQVEGRSQNTGVIAESVHLRPIAYIDYFK